VTSTGYGTRRLPALTEAQRDALTPAQGDQILNSTVERGEVYDGSFWSGDEWDDLRFPFTRDKQGQSEKPDYDFTNMGLLFPQNNSGEVVYITAQMPHSWKAGSGIKPHIHYVQDEAQEPAFKMDYRWYNNNGDPTVAFATLIASTFGFAYTSGSILQIVSFPEIDGSGFGLSSMLDIQIYRDDNVVSGDVLAKEFDIHYQIDRPGSRQEFTK